MFASGIFIASPLHALKGGSVGLTDHGLLMKVVRRCAQVPGGTLVDAHFQQQ